MGSAAILHTSNSHINRFAPLISIHDTSYQITQHVDEDLLRRAEIAGGVTKEIEEDCIKLLQNLTEQSNEAILITCSTLGTIADSNPVINGCKVLRIDQTLAEKAIMLGSKVAVIYAVETTKTPTQALFEKVCQSRNAKNTTIDLHFVDDAWEAFLNGDIGTYNQLIADYILSIKNNADVFALAQASMDKVPALLETLDKPVLSSPQLAIDALIETLSI